MTEIIQNPPKISVLLPVHNADQYLALALDSLLTQTFQDFEVIAINDGSTDLSGKILDWYELRDSRFRVFHRPQKGLVLTLNEGILLARGDWIARMDADDIALPRRFNIQLEQLVRTGADFCGGAVMCFGFSRTIWRYPASNKLCGVQLLFDVPVAHPAVMGRTTAFSSLLYDPSFKHAEDYDLWQRAWVSGYQFTNVPEFVLYYRTHSNQISNQHRFDQKNTADLVRARHWAALCPTLKNDWFVNNIGNSNLKKGAPISLMQGMCMTLSCIPVNCHTIFLKGCLSILLRQPKISGDHLSYWFKMCRLTKVCSWRLKAYGLSVLFLFLILRITPGSNMYFLLRAAKGKFKGLKF